MIIIVLLSALCIGGFAFNILLACIAKSKWISALATVGAIIILITLMLLHAKWQ